MFDYVAKVERLFATFERDNKRNSLLTTKVSRLLYIGCYTEI